MTDALVGGKMGTVNALDAHDRELARKLEPAEKLAEALETMKAGIRLKRAALRAKFPDVDEQEIDRQLTEWLTQDG
jgi:hypothetical protein